MASYRLFNALFFAQIEWFLEIKTECMIKNLTNKMLIIIVLNSIEINKFHGLKVKIMS